MPINRGGCQLIRFRSPLYIEATYFVTECKALHEAVVTLLQTCYKLVTYRFFFSSHVKLCDRVARCLSDFFPHFDLDIEHFGGSGCRELSQLKLINIVMNRDSYACISGRL